MEHTFETVDEKLAEAEFFLKKMVEAGADIFSFKCYVSAFLSASRTITLALQQFKHITGFEEWYKPHQEHLKTNSLAQFFLSTRNEHVHGGPYPVSGGSFHQGKACYFFGCSEGEHRVSGKDIVSTCRNYFILLLEIVYDCYVALGIHVDPQQRYAKEQFAAQGKTIDDAEVEVLGWICTSLIEDGFDEDDRWRELRSHVGECTVNHLFFSYLGKLTPQPTEPDHFADFDYTPEERGWVHTPAGFESLDAYRRSFAKGGVSCANDDSQEGPATDMGSRGADRGE